LFIHFDSRLSDFSIIAETYICPNETLRIIALNNPEGVGGVDE